MKALLLRLLAAFAVVTVIAGCGTVRQESALEWMAKQPNYIDP